MPEISAKFKQGHPKGGAKCGWGRLNAGAAAENWRFSTRSAVNCSLVPSLSQWASTLFVCSTFAVMQRVARVCQRQLILVQLLMIYYVGNSSQLIYMLVNTYFCIKCIVLCYLCCMCVICVWLRLCDFMLACFILNIALLRRFPFVVAGDFVHIDVRNKQDCDWLVDVTRLNPNSITLAGSKLVADRFEAGRRTSSEPASNQLA